MDFDTQVAPDIDVAALGQATDMTFGRSSTPKVATHAIKMKLASSTRLQVDFITVVNYYGANGSLEMKERYDGESRQLIDSAIKNAKKTYKDITGKPLKLKEVANSESTMEPVAMNFFNPVRRAYYRRRVFYQIT